MPLRGDRLRKLRLERRYTHEELAEILSLSVRQISRYESGETDPAGEIIIRIADAFEVSTDYLLGRTDDPASSFKVEDLTQQERDVIRALRRGGVIEAIRVLVKPDD